MSNATRQPPENFRFVADPVLFRSAVGHLGRVPAGVSSKKQLLSLLKEVLQFPEYFGRNWDALAR